MRSGVGEKALLAVCDEWEELEAVVVGEGHPCQLCGPWACMSVRYVSEIRLGIRAVLLMWSRWLFSRILGTWKC